MLDFLLLQQIRAFFAFETISAATFDTFLRRHLEYFPSDFVLPSFLDNHDMNRFHWVVRGDRRRLMLGAICQFTLPHPPIIYYGTEAGLSQRHDLEYPDGSSKAEESRTPMAWGDEQDAELLRFYTELIRFRRAHARLRRGRRRTLVADAAGRYVVAIEGGNAQAVVALNRTEEAQRFALPSSAFRPAIASGAVGVEDDGTLTLAPMVGAVLLGLE